MKKTLSVLISVIMVIAIFALIGCKKAAYIEPDLSYSISTYSFSSTMPFSNDEHRLSTDEQIISAIEPVSVFEPVSSDDPELSVDNSVISAGETSSTESDNPAKVDRFVSDYLLGKNDTEYSYAGGFYQYKSDFEIAFVETTEENGLFKLRLFDDYKDNTSVKFTLFSENGTFITDGGEKSRITVSAGDTIIWKAGELGRFVIENKDKSYNTLYKNYYENGEFKNGYTESQFIEIAASYDGNKVGYGAVRFYFAVKNNVSTYADSSFVFIPEIDGAFQSIKVKKFQKAQHTARICSPHVDRPNGADLYESFYYGTIISNEKPEHISNGVEVYLNATQRDKLFSEGITLETLSIDPDDYGVNADKIEISIGNESYSHYVGFDGIDGGRFQVRINDFELTSEIRNNDEEFYAFRDRLIGKLYEHLWTLDFIEYVVYMEVGGAN